MEGEPQQSHTCSVSVTAAAARKHVPPPRPLPRTDGARRTGAVVSLWQGPHPNKWTCQWRTHERASNTPPKARDALC